MILSPRLENLARSFHSNTSGCRRTCECGREFYDTHNSYDWDEGEIEALEANPNATGVPYSVEGIELPGGEYATDCTCWHKKGLKLIDFLDQHDRHIERWFELERERLAAEVAAVPVLRLTPTFKPLDEVIALTDLVEPASEEHPGIVFARKGEKLTICEVGGHLDYIVRGHLQPNAFHVRRTEIWPAKLPLPH